MAIPSALQDFISVHSTDAPDLSDERCRAVLEAIPHIVWTASPDGSTTYVNRRGAALVGVDARQIHDWRWLELLHPEDVERSRRTWQSAVRTGTEYVNEYRLRQADGTYRWYLAQAAPLRRSGGGTAGWVGTWTDIDDRKRAEEGHARVAAQLRLQIDRTPLAYLLLDRELRVVDWNGAAERLFGYTREEALGMAPPFEKILPRSAWPAGEEVLRRLRSGDMAAHGVNENLTKDGRSIVCEWSNTPLFDHDGAFVGVISLAQDITARRLAEEALRASEERFRQIAESISEVFWLTTPDKHEIAYVSPGYETIWGRARDAVYASPQSWMEAIHPDDRERIVQAAFTNQTAGTYDEEYRIVRPDGTVRWIRDRAFPVRDGDGHVVRIAGVAEDITEKRQLEAQLHQAQKMEAIGQLAGGVAHDFNNLLTVINGYSELLLDAIGDRADLRELLEEIRKAGERSASLTRQLLAFSRQQVLAPKIVDVNEVVHDMEKMLRRLIGEDVELTTVLQRPLGSVKADRGQLEQVLLNLAVNARDAMPRGGALTIQTREVDFTKGSAVGPRGLAPGRYVALVVTDSGVGMSEEVKRHLFEPFFTTKDPGKGTGLGLAVVHGFVRQSGGYVDVRSEPGAGACFTIYLPHIDAGSDSAAGVAAAGVGHPRGTETILLVEDDEAVRSLTKRVLQRCGYSVLEASRGTDGLRLATEHAAPIQLLITDVVMPGIPGRMVADQIGQSHPETKVLYVSGHTTDNVLRTGVMHDAVQFLQKPFAPEVMARKVREILSS